MASTSSRLPATIVILPINPCICAPWNAATRFANGQEAATVAAPVASSVLPAPVHSAILREFERSGLDPDWLRSPDGIL